MRLILLPQQPIKLIPRFVFRPEWSKESHRGLVQTALRAGFTGIDTTCQSKVIAERVVGAEVRSFLAKGKIDSREDLYVRSLSLRQLASFSSAQIQTNFTPLSPDPSSLSPIPVQVHTSINSSIHNLFGFKSSTGDAFPYIDTLILELPTFPFNEYLSTWRILEEFVPSTIHYLGISNANLHTLHALYKASTIKPTIVQHRLKPRDSHSRLLRQFCEQKGIVLQTFLTPVDSALLRREKVVEEVSKELAVSRELAASLLILGLGNTSMLTGERSNGGITMAAKGLEGCAVWLERPDNRER